MTRRWVVASLRARWSSPRTNPCRAYSKPISGGIGATNLQGSAYAPRLNAPGGDTRIACMFYHRTPDAEGPSLVPRSRYGASVDLVHALGEVAAPIAAAAAAIGSWWAATRSNQTTRGLAAIERDRRHDELTPDFEVTCTTWDGSPDQAFLSVTLLPGKLERLDAVTITILDEAGQLHWGRGPLPVTPEQAAAFVWGPWEFNTGASEQVVSNRQTVAQPYSLVTGRSWDRLALTRTRPGHWMTGTTPDQWRAAVRQTAAPAADHVPPGRARALDRAKGRDDRCGWPSRLLTGGHGVQSNYGQAQLALIACQMTRSSARSGSTSPTAPAKALCRLLSASARQSVSGSTRYWPPCRSSDKGRRARPSPAKGRSPSAPP